MDQLPNLGREQEMLSIMGLNSIDDLFSNIPDGVKRTEPLPLPPPQILILIQDHLSFLLVWLEILFQPWLVC